MNDQPSSSVLDAEFRSWNESRPTASENESLTQVMRDRWQSLAEEETVPRVMVDRRLRPSRADAKQLGPAERSGYHRRPRLLTASLLLATAAVVVFLVGWIIQPQSVYAQAIAAINAARTIHAVAEQFDESGKSTGTDAEIWYDVVRGVREEDQNKLGLRVRVDDGVHQWIYRESAGTLVKGKSQDPVGVIYEMLTPMKSLEEHGAKRDETLDKVLSGDPCDAYRSDRTHDDVKIRMVGWIDSKVRMRQFEEQRFQDGRWMTDERVELQYDQPIDATQFVASFPDARLIDRSESMRAFSPDRVVAKAQRLKIQVAVHSVRRLEDDTVLVFWSNSIAESVTREFGKLYPGQAIHKDYGDAQWASNGRRLADHSWQEGVNPISIANWSYEGVDYEWTLLLHASRMIKDDNQLSAGFHLHTRREWQKKLKAEGKPWYLSAAKDMLKIPVPRKTETLDEATSDAYNQIEALGDGTRAGSPILSMRSIPWSKERIAEEVAGGLSEYEANLMLTQEQGSTFDTTLPQWQAVIEERVEDALRQSTQ